jgi:hypothetical protein
VPVSHAGASRCFEEVTLGPVSPRVVGGMAIAIAAGKTRSVRKLSLKKDFP